MDKGPCAKFCGVLIRFQKIIKLQRFEFNVSDVIPTNAQIISPLVFSALLWTCLRYFNSPFFQFFILIVVFLFLEDTKMVPTPNLKI